MKVGTRSVLYGVHCFLIHPVFVAYAWIKLYGFPWDVRIWLAFFVHDLGYWGKPNMDGPEGETHVELGARIMGLFGKEWADFSRYHSRFYAKKDGVLYSKLCVADKLSICVEPYWLYITRARLSGEIHEYMARAGLKSKFSAEPLNKYEHMMLATETRRAWFDAMTSYLRRWVVEHKSVKEDKWTKLTVNDKNYERA